MAHHHLPPSCVAGPRAGLTAALLEFGKQAAALSNADLALSDWNPREAQQLLKAASRDITTATTGMNRATADLNSHQG
jgi:hypothetical protein